MSRNAISWPRTWALVGKDLRETLHQKMVVIPMIVLPVVLCVVIPIVMVFATAGGPGTDDLQEIEAILPLYDIPDSIEAAGGAFAYVFLNYSFLPLFIIIPLMASSIIAAGTVVGERERKTLETLLYTPITNREFLVAKFLGAFLPAISVALGAFVLYFASSNILSYLKLGVLITTAPIWIPVILALVPAVSVVGLSATLIVSLKAKTFMEAQQLSAMVVIPFVGLLYVQIFGLIVFSAIGVVGLSAVLLLIGYIIITRLGPRFDRERVLSRM